MSFSTRALVLAGEVVFWPRGFNTASYAWVLLQGGFWTSLWVSAQRMVVGIAINVVLVLLLAFPLSKEKHEFRARALYVWFFFFTMLFEGGLIPLYMTVATLGLVYPWLRVATTRYFANNARFGSTAVSFHAGAGRLFRRWLTVVAPGFAAIGLFIAVNGEGFEALGSLWNALREGKVIANPVPLVLFVVRKFDLMPLWLVVLSFSLFVWYRVGEFRYFVGAMRIGETRLSSRMDTAIVYGVYFAFLVVVVGAALFLLIGVLGSLIGFVKPTGVTGNQVIFLTTTVLLLAIYWFYGFVRMLLVKVTLLTNICETLSLERQETLDRTVQATAALPRHGEGLADALDVGGL